MPLAGAGAEAEAEPCCPSRALKVTWQTYGKSVGLFHGPSLRAPGGPRALHGLQKGENGSQKEENCPQRVEMGPLGPLGLPWAQEWPVIASQERGR